MEIDINQQKISIGDKYKIFIDGQQTHYASRKLIGLPPAIYLYQVNTDRPRMTIEKYFSFQIKYDITRWDNNVLTFRTISFWKRQYECPVQSDVYTIYGHRGRKYSIYKNDRQVAWWNKNALSWFAGDKYKTIADKDADTSLLISFCLIVDNFSSYSWDWIMRNIEFGNIGFQARKFDPDWQPK